MFGLCKDLGRLEDSLVRGFGRIIAFEGFRADAFFFEEFNGGGEEVMKESPFLGV